MLRCCVRVNTLSAPDVLCLVLVIVVATTFPLPSTSWEWIATQSLKRRPSPYLQQPFWEFVELLLSWTTAHHERASYVKPQFIRVFESVSRTTLLPPSVKQHARHSCIVFFRPCPILLKALLFCARTTRFAGGFKYGVYCGRLGVVRTIALAKPLQGRLLHLPSLCRVGYCVPHTCCAVSRALRSDTTHHANCGFWRSGKPSKDGLQPHPRTMPRKETEGLATTMPWRFLHGASLVSWTWTSLQLKT